MLADLAERETDLLAAIGMASNKDHCLTLAACISALRGAKASMPASATTTTNAGMTGSIGVATALPLQLDAAEQQWINHFIHNGNNTVENTAMEQSSLHCICCLTLANVVVRCFVINHTSQLKIM